jgi:hypothetical protein
VKVNFVLDLNFLSQPRKQGGQIGRIFAQWAIVYSGQLKKKTFFAHLAVSTSTTKMA